MIETAVLGTGYGVDTYAKALQVHPIFDLELVYSRDQTKAKAARKEFGFKRFSTELDSVLEDAKINLVCIATPPHTHFEIAKKALENKKHVICSAPFCLSEDEASELQDLAKEHDCLAVVDHHINYFPARKYAQRLIQDGKIGKLNHIERIYRDNSLFHNKALSLWKMKKDLLGGSFALHGSLDIDYLIRIAGGIKQVDAQLFNSKSFRHATDGEMLQNETDDSFQLGITFHSGVQAQVYHSRSYMGKKQDEFIFHGYKGALHFSNNSDLTFYDYESGDRTRLALPPAYQLANIPGSYRTAAFYTLLELFSSAIYHNTPISPTFDEAVHVQRILDASFKSNKLKKTIFIGDEESAPVKPQADEIIVKKIYD